MPPLLTVEGILLAEVLQEWVVVVVLDVDSLDILMVSFGVLSGVVLMVVILMIRVL